LGITLLNSFWGRLVLRSFQAFGSLALPLSKLAYKIENHHFIIGSPREFSITIDEEKWLFLLV